MSSPLVRKFGAELIGTFGLVFGGCATIIANYKSPLSPVLVALSFGVVIAIMVAATLHISGGHINPAVSIGLWATRHLPTKDLFVYLLAQLIGAILAALALLAVFGYAALVSTVTLPTPAEHLSAIQATSIEAIGTAFLVFVIAATATDAQGVGKLAPFAIGAAILVGALWAGPLTGASFNPARSIGPALIAGNFNDLWMYIVGPIVGGIVGAVLYQLIRQPAERAQVEKLSAEVTPREIAAARKRR